MGSSLVSVLVPCYNAAPYVAAALDSVLAQTWSNIEVIVVDDGSTDESPAIVESYADRGVRLIRQSHEGQCVAANRAYAVSSGHYVKFFDADDVLGPDMIERQISRLDVRRDAIALGEWARFSDRIATARFEARGMYRDSLPVDWLAKEWTDARPMMQCALWLIPRHVLEQSGGWDERLSLINDFEFFTRVALSAAEILYTPGARLYYRSNVTSSLSGRKTRSAIESAFLSRKLGTEHLLDAEDSSRTRRACANILQDFDYNYYPDHPDLRALVRARVAELGGSDLIPDGPPGFQRLRAVIGWRGARRVQHLAERLKLNGAGRKSRTADRFPSAGVMR